MDDHLSCSMDNRQQLAEENQSVVSRMQKKFWKTKQVLIKVTGKKEDEYVVASDADLDSKLEIFHSIQATSLELLKIIERYQQALNDVSLEENELGLLLKVHAQQNSTRAGKMMKATGNALCSSAGQRLSLCSPLSRLEQEMATFSGRAISDTLVTVNQMEKARTEYRGALLWMKDVSQELDPDTYKQMERFRKVQMQVKNTKSHFDKKKMDVCQKVDLLGASRCNLLLQLLTTYQTTLLRFWKTTAHLMNEIQEEFPLMLPYCLSHSTEQIPEQSSQEEILWNSSDGNKNKPVMSNETAAEDQEAEHGKKDLLLNSTEGDDFDKEFSFLNLKPSTAVEPIQDEQDIFGGSMTSSISKEPLTKQSTNLSGFLPSQLLDLSLQSAGGLSNWTYPTPSPGGSQPNSQYFPPKNSSNLPATYQKAGNKDMSAWLNMFADLDPLANLGGSRRSDNELSSA
ncbi:islet cell autoantigen 1-like protein [Rhinophrynus dorsalis]